MKTLRETVSEEPLCVYCLKRGASLYEDLGSVTIIDANTSKPLVDGVFEAKGFCSPKCRDQYYYDDMASGYETKYVPRLTTFYTRQLMACPLIKEELFRKWVLLREATNETLVTDLHRLILRTCVGVLVHSHTRLIHPSRLGYAYSHDDCHVMMAGRDLLYNDNNVNIGNRQPLYVQELCGVINIASTSFLLFYDGSIRRVKDRHIYLHSDNNALFSPMQIPSVIQIAYSNSTILTLNEDGSIYGWGLFYKPDALCIMSQFIIIGRFDDMQFGHDNLSISVAPTYIMVVKRDGTLWTMGNTQWTEDSMSDQNGGLVKVPFYGGRIIHVHCHPERPICYVTTIDSIVWELHVDVTLCSHNEKQLYITDKTVAAFPYQPEFKGDTVISYTRGSIMTNTGTVFQKTDMVWKEVDFRIPLVPHYAHHTHKKSKTQ